MNKEFKMSHAKIENYKQKVNPKIARDIKNLIKPYIKLINKSSNYYNLRSLAHRIDRIGVRVNADVTKLLLLSKQAAQQEIEKKIQRIESREKEYTKKELEEFLHNNRIKSRLSTMIGGLTYGKNVINLDLEDFKVITKNAKSAKLFFFDIRKFNGKILDFLFKRKLKGMKNAALIITGNKNTTLDELDSIWQSILKNLPKNSKTCCSYKIGNVKNLQLNLLAIR